jgi:integrase
MGLPPEFPLFPHGSDDEPHRLRWAKKIRGKLRYFGKVVDDPKGENAIRLWLDQKDDLLAGRTPRQKTGGVEVRDLCNHFLTAKLRLLKSGEITPRTFDDYRSTTDRIIVAFGERRLVTDLSTSDFDKLRSDLAETLGVVALSNAIQRVRSVFQYGFNAELLDRPLRLATFKRPSKKSIRLARAEKGPRLFDAAPLRQIIAASDVQLRAMVLLAVNGGLGNSDIASLPLKALDLEARWLNFPRPKTGIDRRIPLWPETVAAVKAAIAKRPSPKDANDAGLVFITKHGHNWGKLGRFDGEIDLTQPNEGQKRRKGISSNNSLSKEFRKLAENAGVARTFYDLRHTFRTIGDEAKDQPAVNSIMGHADESMAALYRERISDDRLRAVTDHVRAWLFPKSAKKPKATGRAAQAATRASAKPAQHVSADKSVPRKRATATVPDDVEWTALRIVG